MAGSPISLLAILTSTLSNKGLVGTWEFFKRVTVQQETATPAGGTQEKFLAGEDFESLWRVQKAFSRQLSKASPQSRIGQYLYTVNESSVGAWARMHLSYLANFDPSVIFLMEETTLGGNERFTDAVIAAATTSGLPSKVLVLRTSGTGGLTITSDFLVKASLGYLDDEQKTRIIEILLETLNVKKLIVANSRVGWKFLAGARKEKFHTVSFYANLYCADFDDFGREIGFGKTHFPKAAIKLSGIISDNLSYPQFLIERQSEIVGTNAPKIIKFSIPSRFSTILEMEDGDPNNIVWIGRLVRQKGYISLKRIAKRNPELNFHFFSHGSGLKSERFSRSLSPNVALMGSFKDLRELSDLRGAIYFNTSKWDGLPNTLIEMVSAGIPVITTDLPGIRELKNENPSLPIFFLTSCTTQEFKKALNQAKNWLKLDKAVRTAEIQSFSIKRTGELDVQVEEFLRDVQIAQ